MTAPTYVICAEEKALLDAAKRVAAVWGQKDGGCLPPERGERKRRLRLSSKSNVAASW